MFLLILDEDPYIAALRIPDRYKHKQLLELMQMLSCIVNFGYKQLPTGKKLKDWIIRNKAWTYAFAYTLYDSLKGTLKPNTRIKYTCLMNLLAECTDSLSTNAETAIWRYNKEYTEFTVYKTDSELPFRVVIKEYERYLKWKELNFTVGKH